MNLASGRLASAFPFAVMLACLWVASAPRVLAKGPSIQIISVDPPLGSEVGEQTNIRAIVGYELPKGARKRKEHYVSIKFSNLSGGTFSVAKTPPNRRILDRSVALRSSGQVELRYALDLVLQKSNLAREPVVVWFYLHEGRRRSSGMGKSTVIAKTPPIFYRIREVIKE